MALLLLLVLALGATTSIAAHGEIALANVTRFAVGDYFTIHGSDCGLTRCMELSQGTAMAAGGLGQGGCVCQCRSDLPTFREDSRLCVSQIEECQVATFGRGTIQEQVPLVFLPMKGQIIHPSKEIVFTDIEDAICAVTSAQYLSSSGWVTLRDIVDNDVPFGFYRDEGKTFLQWRGSALLHARLEGRVVAAHVLCSAPTALVPVLATSCAAFRVAGATNQALFDVRSIPFSAGETVSSEPTHGQGLSVLESLAIGVCVLLLIFVYAAGIVFYIHYKQRQRRKDKDVEMSRTNTLSTDNGSNLDARLDLESLNVKTNPLLKIDPPGVDFLQDSKLSEIGERTTENTELSEKTFKKPHIIAAMVHARRNKMSNAEKERILKATMRHREVRLMKRSPSPDAYERAPNSDLAFVDCSVDTIAPDQQPHGDAAFRRKLYFNPVFFEAEHLKNPPPAAIEFLVKIREVMAIAKERMTSKKFLPILSDIPEEESYHTIDLGWDIPCARTGRRFSAISLKRENSRRSATHGCGGCPGCSRDEGGRGIQSIALNRSNSCKTCVSEEFRQRIVRKWLDEVPLPPETIPQIKSISKVSGTPRIIEPMKTLNIRRHNEAEGKEDLLTNIKEPIESNDIIESPKPMKLLELTKIKNVLHMPEGLKLPHKDSKKIARSTPERDDVSEKTKHTKSQELKHKIEKKDIVVLKNDLSPVHTGTRKIRKKLPPPPPPPVTCPDSAIFVKTEEEKERVVIPLEVKKKMAAVIRELSGCHKVEPVELEEIRTECVAPIAPKIVIPVLAADSCYYSDDNTLNRKRDPLFTYRDDYEVDSLERNSIVRKRRFSLACAPEMLNVYRRGSIDEYQIYNNLKGGQMKPSHSWRDVRTAFEGYKNEKNEFPDNHYEKLSLPVSEIFVNQIEEPQYGNIALPGPLTIQVRGSPVNERKNLAEEFDPDTLDRKPRRIEKRVDKILLKSAGSFKCKSQTTPDRDFEMTTSPAFSRKIGSLRQIYESKTKIASEDAPYTFYSREDQLMQYDSPEMMQCKYMRAAKTPDLIRQVEYHRDPKPPIPPKQRRPIESAKYQNMMRDSPIGERRFRQMQEDRERLSLYAKSENIHARRSGRRSTRTRSRRTDLRKLCRTEDSGYLSTDSNESKRRAKFLMQLRARNNEPTTICPVIEPPVAHSQLASDTDELESLCDGRSESGGESVETDSVFFGNYDESKQLIAELNAFTSKTSPYEQIDSGFAGETNIILSGDSDSEHRSVISIVTGRDGRASSASITRLDEPQFIQSIGC